MFNTSSNVAIMDGEPGQRTTGTSRFLLRFFTLQSHANSSSENHYFGRFLPPLTPDSSFLPHLLLNINVTKHRVLSDFFPPAGEQLVLQPVSKTGTTETSVKGQRPGLKIVPIFFLLITPLLHSYI